MRRDDSEMEDELDYFRNVTPPPEEEEAMEDRWWSPEPRGPPSEEENEEDNQYINDLLMGDLEVKRSESGLAELQAEVGVVVVSQDHQVCDEGSEEKEGGHRESGFASEPPAKRSPREDAQEEGGAQRAGDMGCVAERNTHEQLH
jgi:hypothetical protein